MCIRDSGQDGTVRAEFINKGVDGIGYRMGWSRYLTQTEGEAELARLAATSCPSG